MLPFSGIFSLHLSEKKNFFAILNFYNFSLEKTKHNPEYPEEIPSDTHSNAYYETNVILRKMYISRNVFVCLL